MSKGRKCYKWGPSPKDFNDAAAYCNKHNAKIQLIESQEENDFFRENSSSTTYWLGLTNVYKTRRTKYFTNWKESRSQYSFYNNDYCASWGSETGYWYLTDCDNFRLFLCEKIAECIQGRFGQNCEKTYHCYGEHSSGRDNTCKYGCHKGWMGKSCDILKVKVTALYYCLKSSTHGHMLIIRADQRGIDYQQVLAVDENGDPATTCNKSTFSKQGDKLQMTIGRNTSDSEDFRPDCGAQRISKNVFKWRFQFIEFSGAQSIYDIIFEMTCDFDKADSLQRGATTKSKKKKIKTKSLSKTQLLVELTVKDPYTGLPLKKAKLNQNARLVLELNTTDEDMAVKKISPYSCVAGTEDGVHAVVFLDHNGDVHF
ncbi:uncharacterized protein LOC121375948 isoform X2 [Gigantopelta aegis]|uniref:uncharacterized protein LOC121375948 isoform X2 n=1 Tax=Gigantopelta aegis TaxID=1735272 RepID=UPI001B88BB11|nr:uncharacterized protein LOC121375948 isoform X2 [Gigantopelta aegis]